MKKTSKIAIVFGVVAILLIGVGYAAIENISLTINGTATADPSQSNFVVKFDQSVEPIQDGKGTITAKITDDTKATLNVTGLATEGEKASVTYTVKNDSKDLSANLTASITQKNNEYFKVTQEIGKTSLTKGETTTLKVTVELIKTPSTENEDDTINVTLTAQPVQPAE